MPGKRFTNKNRITKQQYWSIVCDKQRERKTPYRPPPFLPSLNGREKLSLHQKKKPINDLSIIIIESKK